MASSLDQWVQVSREAGTWLVDEVLRLPSFLTNLVANAGLAVLVAGTGHLLYNGAERLLEDE